jgi:peptidoglycan hydrolase-like protein with peptidoglycan-binding domain
LKFVSERNLASPDVWADSLSRSRTRRAAALRAAKKRLRTRGGAVSTVAAIAAMGVFAAFAGASGDLMKRGAEGDGVAAVQKALGVEADGVYGPVTRAAVTKYQKRNGLTVDGVVGPETLGSLGVKANVVNASYSPGSSGGGGSSGGDGGVPAVLERIAQCESGGDPTAVGGGGLYRGKYQFMQATWESVGGKGDPAKASEAEQDKRAVMLYNRAGTSPWGCA